MKIRIGHGFDVHKFGGDKPLLLAGVHVKHDIGLIAHSDGDLILHAVMDAILGALALGDIGKHFPDTSAKFKDADSSVLLNNVYKMAKDKGYVVNNLDVTVMAQSPKLSPYIELMNANLAKYLETDLVNVNVKATTTEKLGFVGRAEGLAATAVILLVAV